jgi:hypothetical protein
MNGNLQISAQDIYTPSSVQQHAFGQMGQDKYGDLYRYALIGASDASAGQLQLAPVQKTNHHNCAAYAAVTANGLRKKVTLTLGATAAVLNEYSGGLLIANDNSPEGEFYRITGHPAADSAATLEVTVDRPFKTSIATTSEFTLVHNNYNKVVVGTTVTIPAAGVPAVDMTAAYFGWLKTKGVASVLIGSAATLGADLIVGGTNGSVTDRTDALGASAEPVVAVASIALGVTGEYNPVVLCID